MSHVDPPDLGLLPTFRRLLGLWRAQWRLGVFGLSCSVVYTLIWVVVLLAVFVPLSVRAYLRTASR